VLLGQLAQVGDRIEVSRVDLSGVPDQDRRLPIELAERRSKSVHVQASGGVPSQDADPIAAQADHPQGLLGAGMQVARREHRDRRHLGQPFPVDIHSPAEAAPPSGAGQPDEVRHRRPGGQDPAPPGGKPEEVAEPGDSQLGQLRPQRRGHPQARVLVEGRRDPVRPEGGRRDAALDEVEEPGAGGRHGCLEPLSEEPVERGHRAVAAFGERSGERIGPLVHVPSAERTLVESLQVVADPGDDQLEDLVDLTPAGPGHGAESSAWASSRRLATGCPARPARARWPRRAP
jgi:hypothetical protein